jgi:hypothetical protein
MYLFLNPTMILYLACKDNFVGIKQISIKNMVLGICYVKTCTKSNKFYQANSTIWSLEIVSISFWYKNLFLLFFNPWLRNEIKKSCRIPTVKKKTCYWHWFRPLK